MFIDTANKCKIPCRHFLTYFHWASFLSLPCLQDMEAFKPSTSFTVQYEAYLTGKELKHLALVKLLAKKSCFEVFWLWKHGLFIRTGCTWSNNDAIPRMLEEHGLVLSCTSSSCITERRTKQFSHSSSLISGFTQYLMSATAGSNRFRQWIRAAIHLSICPSADSEGVSVCTD